MAARVFSDPCTSSDLYYVAPVFDPGLAAGGLAAVAGASPVAVERAQTFLVLAEAQVDRERWGTEKGPLGVCLLAAHMLAEDVIANAAAPSATSTAVASVSVGPVTKTFAPVAASSSPSSDPLATTVWGRRFLALRATLFVRGFT